MSTAAEADVDVDVDALRPRTRGECADVPRPCCFAACPYNLYLDVNESTGTITFNFPHLDITEMKESCALDVADRGEHDGGITLEETGRLFGLTRERIRQIEGGALSKLKDAQRRGNVEEVDFEALGRAASAGHVLSGRHAHEE